MDATEIWRAGETRTVVWQLIKAAGEHGTGRKELIEATGKSSTAVDWHVTNMARDGYIQRPPGISHALWMAGPNLPPIEGLVLELTLAEVEDCPAGVSGEVLCREIGCSAHVLQQALAPAEADGRLERIRMPLAFGGGVGWRVPRPGQHPPQAPAAPQHSVRLPVVEVNIDRIHHVQGERFGLELADGRLSMTSPTLAVRLTAEQTHQLLAYLTPHILRLACDE